MQFVIVCNPENRRREFFDKAVASVGLPKPVVVPYQHLLNGGRLDMLTKDTILRIESPGESFEVWKGLVNLGLSNDGSGGSDIKEEHGRIRYMRPWFSGFVSILKDIQKSIDASGCTPMTPTSAIQLMFDKYNCQYKLSAAGLPIPTMLPLVSSYDELREAMRLQGISRVFIKPLYSSSASGVIAYRWHGATEEATSSIDVIEQNGEYCFYNSLKINRYKHHSEIRRVIEFILEEGAYAEEWIPKATLGREVFDVRIVVIDDEPAFVLPRLSNGPITNLHLGNKRGNVDDLWKLMGEDRFEEMASIARTAVETVGAFYAGVDILIPSGLGKPRVLEINAFGDLLPGLVDDQGNDTYTSELKQFIRKYTINA
jgi:glutathione synthase/RimK-type ligase-like ATP-grasp enzyme